MTMKRLHSWEHHGNLRAAPAQPGAVDIAARGELPMDQASSAAEVALSAWGDLPARRQRPQSIPQTTDDLSIGTVHSIVLVHSSTSRAPRANTRTTERVA